MSSTWGGITKRPIGALLHDVAEHRIESGGLPREEFMARTLKFGWPQHRQLTVPEKRAG
jgi:hypothetical protein